MISWIRSTIPFDMFLSFVIWTLASLVLGLFDLYTFRFDPRRLLNADYLSEVGILLALGVFIFAYRLIQKLLKLKVLDIINSTLETTVNGYVNDDHKLKHIIGFIVYINLKRRIVAYKEKMQRKVGRLLDQLTSEEMKQYSTEEEDNNLYKSNRVKKLINIQKRLTEEYIKENGEYLNAKFVQLTPNFMTSGYNNNRNKSANADPSKKFRTAFFDNFGNFVIPSLLIAFVIGSILVANEADWWAIVLIVSIKLLLLLFQYWNAGRYSPIYLVKTWVHDLHLRKILWENYFSWIIKEKKVVK